MITFHLPIVPPDATSQGAGKRISVRGGKPVFWKSRAAAAAEADLALLCRPHRPRRPLEGPVALTVTFTWPWLRRHPQRLRAAGRVWKVTRPDCSNSIKILEDVLTRTGFWVDDSQVADLRVRKFHGTDVGIVVQVSRIDE